MRKRKGIDYFFPSICYYSDRLGFSTTFNDRARIDLHSRSVLSRSSQPCDSPTSRASSKSFIHPPRTRSWPEDSGGKGKCPSSPASADLSSSPLELFDEDVFFDAQETFACDDTDPPDLSEQARLGLGEESPSVPEDEEDEFDNIDINPALSEDVQNLFRTVLRKYRRVFRKGWGLLNTGEKMPIRLKPDISPIAQAPF